MAGTTLYLWGTTAANITPAPSGIWGVTGSFVERLCSFQTGGGVNETITGPSNTATGYILLGQFKSPSLAAQTINGTVSGVVCGSESQAAANAGPAVAIRVFSSSDTLRGVLLNPVATGQATTQFSAAPGEYTTTLTERFTPTGTGVTSVVCSAGDYLLIEVGGIQTASSANRTISQVFGGANALDLPFNQTGTVTTKNAWIGFSQSLFFSTPQVFTGVGRIKRTDIQKINGVANIFYSLPQKIAGSARIRTPNIYHLIGIARVHGANNRTYLSNARIKSQISQKVSGVAKISLNANIKTQTGVARIYDLTYVPPVSDISTGSWTVAPLYSKISERFADTSDFISSSAAPSNDTAEVKIATVPNSSYASISVNYLYQREFNNVNQITLTFALYQGAIQIAQNVLTNIPNGWVSGQFNLTTGQIASITDYSDLRVRMIAS